MKEYTLCIMSDNTLCKLGFNLERRKLERIYSFHSGLVLMHKASVIKKLLKQQKGGIMIVLDLKDSRPLYEQVAERFKYLILCGALPEDERLPSVRNLAMELSINPNTIQKAYGELERQGFIYTVKGRGNFVSPNDRLKEVRREEIKQQLIELMKEGKVVGLTREEMIDLIEEAGILMDAQNPYDENTDKTAE